jgi:CheY-like chemotaxis protein
MGSVELAHRLLRLLVLIPQPGCICILKVIAEKGGFRGQPGHSHPARVMVVDDDPFVREVVEAALSAAGQAKVWTFGRGEDAVQAASDIGPDLVLLDLFMPDMDGRETWVSLRRILSPEPPVIFLTAQDNPAALRALADLKPLGVVSKPFDPLTVADRIWRLLENKVAPAVQGRARLASVKEKFRISLSATANVLETLVSDLIEGEEGRVATKTLLDKAHRLAGSAGLFQFDSVGAAADRVERLATKCLGAGNRARTAMLTELAEATKVLHAECLEAAANDIG